MTETTLNGVFIEVEVDPAVRGDRELAERLAEVCPVDIYAVAADGGIAIDDENLDECVLCRLCIEASPPGTVRVRKRYSGDLLE
jgi:ferredoxin-like protein FixX